MYISFPYQIYNIVCLYIYVYILVIFIIRLGSACSHVAAVLFKLQACVQLGRNKKASTSKLCQWNVSIQCPYNKCHLNSQEKEIYQRFSTRLRIQNHLVSRILYSIMYLKKEREKPQSFLPLFLRQRYLPAFQNFSQKNR